MDVIPKLPRLAETEVRGEGKIPPKSLAFPGSGGHRLGQKSGEIAPQNGVEGEDQSSRLATQIRSMNDLLSRYKPGFSLLEAYTVTLGDSSHKIRKERS